MKFHGYDSYRAWLTENSGSVRCVRCGASGGEVELTVDHILPTSRGGAEMEWNFQPLCIHCNLEKGSLPEHLFTIGDERPDDAEIEDNPD